jgi:hypothetical protein
MTIETQSLLMGLLIDAGLLALFIGLGMARGALNRRIRRARQDGAIEMLEALGVSDGAQK